MQDNLKPKFPAGSLLAAMFGEAAPVDARRAARRLRAEGAPAVAVDDEVAALARELAASELSRSPAVPDALPPLFWLEAPTGNGSGRSGTSGWVVERKGSGLTLRGFAIGAGKSATPEPQGTSAVRFGATAEDAEEVRCFRGLVTVISLPELMAQMGESAPVLLMPAVAFDSEAGDLRGFRLSVAMSRDSAPS